MMGGASVQSQTLLDLVSHPEQLRAHIDELHQANLARVKSAEEHRKAKAEAEETMAHLQTMKSVHESRELAIAAAKADVEAQSHQLTVEIANVRQKQQEYEQLKQALEDEKVSHQQNVSQFNQQVQAQQQSLAQQEHALLATTKSAAQRHNELNTRESILHAREQFIIAAAHELTSHR